MGAVASFTLVRIHDSPACFTCACSKVDYSVHCQFTDRIVTDSHKAPLYKNLFQSFQIHTFNM